MEPGERRANLLPAFFLFVAVAGLEAWLIHLLVASTVPAVYLLAGHGAAIALAFSASWLLPLNDRTLVNISLVATLFAGPIAAFGGLGCLLSLMLSRRVESPQKLKEWYERLSGRRAVDKATLIFKDLTDQRALKPLTITVPDFSKIMEAGGEAEQQALLGMIGLDYHPDYLPVLKRALASPNPFVRVQAAAVFAKLRETFKNRLKSACACSLPVSNENDPTGQRTDQLLATLRQLTGCLESGFLDPSEIRDGREMVGRLCDVLDPSGDDFSEESLAVMRAMSVARLDDAIADRLLPRGAALPQAFADLLLTSLMRMRREREIAGLLAVRAAGSRSNVSSTPKRPEFAGPAAPALPGGLS